ncbi:FTR1 family iron permease [Clostridium estertheticum]|uniref:FTR1 family iron permease n=1 Tax=Clostridium estertheticum TaxID=238834 RepID=UPI0013E9926B|nr:FTR1 family protein [Clostridium estertheticum]MBZ9688319.1 FTR1 family iron permease [Clostridium estertheticum]
MLKKITYLLLFSVLSMLILTTPVLASDANTALTDANTVLSKAFNLVKSGEVDAAKETYATYTKAWVNYEDTIKTQSKQAYSDIEEKMGMVQFLFSQEPVQKDKLLDALKELMQSNKSFIQGKYNVSTTEKSNNNVQVKDLVIILENAKNQIKKGDNNAALKSMKDFSSKWIEVEGVILTQSQKIYNDAEKDMVASKAYLSVEPKQPEKALKVIERMIGYMSQVAGDNTYSIVDVMTIILREGLEALLVVVALLGFLKKSGNEDKKGWIFGGVGIGLAVSFIVAILVKLLFSSGTFGNNNFLISGWTGVFAAVMLIYVSYWLHSKSSANEWQNYIHNKSSKALAKGSLFSLGFLAFLAVFREGTETVLFYIGMASSVGLPVLLSGIAIGVAILVIVAFLMLKLGLRIPMRPFFLISSLLVFYLGLKFTGMGINGLQNAGVLSATSSDNLPTISWLAVYPSWQSVVPQIVLVVGAIVMIVKNNINSNKIRGLKS